MDCYRKDRANKKWEKIEEKRIKQGRVLNCKRGIMTRSFFVVIRRWQIGKRGKKANENSKFEVN